MKEKNVKGYRYPTTIPSAPGIRIHPQSPIDYREKYPLPIPFHPSLSLAQAREVVSFPPH